MLAVGLMEREKGKEGERQAARFLRSLGYADAYRGQQYSGVEGRDAVIPSRPNVHVEAKYGYGTSATNHVGSAHLREWYAQARRDAGDRFPIVLWKPFRARAWRLTCLWYGVLATVTDPGDMQTIIDAYGNGEGEPS